MGLPGHQLKTGLADYMVKQPRRRGRTAPLQEPELRLLVDRLDDASITGIIDGYGQGRSARLLAAEHGVSKNSVLRLLRTYGVPIRASGPNRGRS